MSLHNDDIGERLLLALQRIEEKLERLRPAPAANEPFQFSSGGKNDAQQEQQEQQESSTSNTSPPFTVNFTGVTPIDTSVVRVPPAATAPDQSTSEEAPPNANGLRAFGFDRNGNPVYADSFAGAMKEFSKIGKQVKREQARKKHRGDVNRAARVQANSDYLNKDPAIYEKIQERAKDEARTRVYSETITKLQKDLMGNLSQLPRDGRIDFVFQKHAIRDVDDNIVQAVLSKMTKKRAEMLPSASIVVRDFDRHGNGIEYSNVKAPQRASNYGSVDPYEYFILPRNDTHRDFDGVDFTHPIFKAHVTVPFRRYIHIYGLSCMAQRESIDKFGGLNFIFIRRPDAADPAYYLQDFLLQHILPTGLQPSLTPRISFKYVSQECTMVFHIVGYQILREVPIDFEGSSPKMMRHDPIPAYEMWEHGYMHDRRTRIRKTAFSALITHEIKMDSPKFAWWDRYYWTALLLCPHSESPPSPRFRGPGKQRPCSVFMDIVMICVDETNRQWDVIGHYMDRYLSDASTFMQPDQHDTLLVDDESFSRSRKYFWVISTLSDFEDKLQITIDQWPVYKKNWTTSYQSGHPENWDYEALEKLAEIDKRMDDFRDRLAHFKALRIRTAALRDGLFNASSVMESRAANHLGQNVKQLTMVSIFFLPLAFTTSVFSINVEAFNPTIIPWIACLIGFATYLVVFNLNNIINLIRYFYHTRRVKVMDRLSDDSKIQWNKSSYQHKTFNRRITSPMPKSSKWFLARDILHSGFTVVWTKAKSFSIQRKQSSRARTDVEAPVEGVRPINKIVGKATAEQVERVSIELVENQDADQVQTRIGTTTT